MLQADDSRKYNDDDITDYNETIIRAHLGGFRADSNGKAKRFLLDKKFHDGSHDYILAVTPAIDTAGSQFPIDYFLDKSRQIKNPIAEALKIVIPTLEQLDRIQDDALRKTLTQELSDLNLNDELIEKIIRKLKKAKFDKIALEEKVRKIDGQLQRRDVFEEIIPEMLKFDRCYSKIVFPYNKTQVHWLSGEIVINKVRNLYQIEVYTHDPYGRGMMEPENYKTIKEAIERRIKKEDLSADVVCDNKVSPYGRRQRIDDGVSCGIITAEDIIKLIGCLKLDIVDPYEYGAITLREKHLEQINLYGSEAVKRRFASRYVRAKALIAGVKSQCVEPPLTSSTALLSESDKRRLVSLISKIRGAELKGVVTGAFADDSLYHSKDDSYLIILVRSAIEERVLALQNRGEEVIGEDILAINEIHRILFNKNGALKFSLEAVYQIGKVLEKSLYEETRVKQDSDKPQIRPQNLSETADADQVAESVSQDEAKPRTNQSSLLTSENKTLGQKIKFHQDIETLIEIRETLAKILFDTDINFNSFAKLGELIKKINWDENGSNCIRNKHGLRNHCKGNKDNKFNTDDKSAKFDFDILKVLELLAKDPEYNFFLKSNQYALKESIGKLLAKTDFILNEELNRCDDILKKSINTLYNDAYIVSIKQNLDESKSDYLRVLAAYYHDSLSLAILQKYFEDFENIESKSVSKIDWNDAIERCILAYYFICIGEIAKNISDILKFESKPADHSVLDYLKKTFNKLKDYRDQIKSRTHLLSVKNIKKLLQMKFTLDNSLPDLKKIVINLRKDLLYYKNNPQLLIEYYEVNKNNKLNVPYADYCKWSITQLPMGLENYYKQELSLKNRIEETNKQSSKFGVRSEEKQDEKVIPDGIASSESILDRDAQNVSRDEATPRKLSNREQIIIYINKIANKGKDNQIEVFTPERIKSIEKNIIEYQKFIESKIDAYNKNLGNDAKNIEKVHSEDNIQKIYQLLIDPILAKKSKVASNNDSISEKNIINNGEKSIRLCNLYLLDESGIPDLTKSFVLSILYKFMIDDFLILMPGDKKSGLHKPYTIQILGDFSHYEVLAFNYKELKESGSLSQQLDPKVENSSIQSAILNDAFLIQSIINLLSNIYSSKSSPYDKEKEAKKKAIKLPLIEVFAKKN